MRRNFISRYVIYLETKIQKKLNQKINKSGV